MIRFRDAKTGFYITEEEARQRDPATWVKERDRRKEDNEAKDSREFKGSKGGGSELKAVYYKCKEAVSVPGESLIFGGTGVIPLFVLRGILNEFGAGIPEDE